MHSPQVTEAVLRSKLGITTKATRGALIDLYLRQVREGGGLGKDQSPLRKSSKTPGGKKPLPKESKAQMLARLRGHAEALCRSQNSEALEIDGSSFRLRKVNSCGTSCARWSRIGHSVLTYRTLSTQFHLRPTSLLGQELGAGADALIFQAECVSGKLNGRSVVVKMQPRHKDTRWQVMHLSGLGRQESFS